MELAAKTSQNIEAQKSEMGSKNIEMLSNLSGDISLDNSIKQENDSI